MDERMTMTVGLMLSICAIEDGFKKRISILWPTAGIVAGIIFCLNDGAMATAGFWLGLLFGVVMLVIAAISRGQMGYGDALVLGACGICLGWAEAVLVLVMSMFLFLAIGIIGMWMKKWNRKKEIAFIPFVWGAFLAVCLMKRC